MKSILIGRCLYYPETGVISSDKGETTLPPQVSKVFTQLANAQNDVVNRNDIMERAWPQQIVNDESLTHCICVIRKNLKNLGCGMTVDTLPKRGYRLNSCCKTANNSCSPIWRNIAGIGLLILVAAVSLYAGNA